MENAYSTEHINNDEVQYIFDSLFQKVTNELTAKYDNGDFGEFSAESMYIALIMFNKYKIQFYSIMKLTYGFTQNPLKQYEYFDIASINTLIRACYETYLTYHYIYSLVQTLGELDDKLDFGIDKSKDVLELKLLLYKYEGYKQNVAALSSVKNKQKEHKEQFKQVKDELYKNKLFLALTKNEQESLLANWRPSWNKIASLTVLSEWNSKNMYNLLSQHGHNSYSSLMNIAYHYTHLNEYDKDAINMQLYEISALLIMSIIREFVPFSNIYTKDENNILNEFYFFATINPDSFNTVG